MPCTLSASSLYDLVCAGQLRGAVADCLKLSVPATFVPGLDPVPADILAAARQYAAEEAARLKAPRLPALGEDDVAAWTNHAVRRAFGPEAPTVVIQFDGVADSNFDHVDERGIVHLGPGTACHWTACHEAAHSVGVQLGDHDGHGPVFAARMLGLVAQIGRRAAFELSESYRRHGVQSGTSTPAKTLEAS